MVSRNDLAGATEQRQCDVHGAYTARQRYGSYWTHCPACLAEVEQRQQEREAERRRVQQEVADAQRLEWCLRLSGIEGRFARATFDSYDAPLPAQAAALSTCKTFAVDFKPDAGGGLWLIGPPGTGKTHLGSAIVSHVIREHKRSASIHGVHEIMQMLKGSFGKRAADDAETTEEVLERLGTQSLLVLDEIGVARDSEWQREQIFTIVDRRYRLERPTVVISNLPAAELKEVLGQRAYDRLREGSRQVLMSWPSHRGSRA